jgi:superfamily II DNA or RNA helicase
MNSVTSELFKSLQTGFIDSIAHSKTEYRPQLIVNDKQTGKKVLTTIDYELNRCDEFWFSVAFITTSGIATLHNTLLELEERGVKGKILASQYLNFTQPEALRKLLKFDNIELRIAADSAFHSKGYLFKDKELYSLIIGSSNFTSNAFCSNKELNIKISAKAESEIILNTIKEFSIEFENSIIVDDKFIETYEEIYKKQIGFNKLYERRFSDSIEKEIKPNTMQIEALVNLKKIRNEGKNKALLISATGTGKTYLSAFDVKNVNPKKFLFIVHRKNIAEAALRTFNSVFKGTRSMGYFSGATKEIEKDFIFSTIQTISLNENLSQFKQDQFDYIVIDETHRAGASSYKKVLDFFRPAFILGMTATPERTDGFDIFSTFDHNIAYEIRLHRALEEDMLSSFHYYGVTEIDVAGVLLEDNASFNLLYSEKRVSHVIEKIKLYGCDNGIVRGLVFCSSVEECDYFAKQFNFLGIKSIALSGNNSDEERANAIELLESEDPSKKIDYIFTRDIFNEGIDIPKVNQIVMLRPTQSAIIFVQQLGRGLRKVENKEYLTVIDFIGNYSNNYMVPIALYGDTSYNKDSIRKFISSGSRFIPGESTINFDRISKEKIYSSIDIANLHRNEDLKKDYNLLKFKLGRIPMMVDFLEHGSRDPMLYVLNSKSYFNFVKLQENSLNDKLENREIKLLELFSKEINNAIRVEESQILKHLIEKGPISIPKFKEEILIKYGYELFDISIDSFINNLNFLFITEKFEKKLIPAGSIYNYKVVDLEGNNIFLNKDFSAILKNDVFTDFLMDNINFSIFKFDSKYDFSKFINGFQLYSKYSRKDVFRVLNWSQNPVAQNVGGYIINSNKSNCPVFVNYHKDDDISSTTKYEDGFINNSEFEWMSKSNRNLNSPDVKAIIEHKKLGMRIPLFIKKSNGESDDFYFMGDVTPLPNSWELAKMENEKGKEVSVVKLVFSLENPVEEGIYNYLTNK